MACPVVAAQALWHHKFLYCGGGQLGNNNSRRPMPAKRAHAAAVQ